MAHVGNLYPVLPRRDFNLNVESNRRGWAKRYIVQLGPAGTGFGSFATQGIYDCGPGIEGPFGTITWTSGHFRTGPFDFQVKLLMDIGAGGWFYEKTGQLFETHVGLIAVWQIGQVQETFPQFGRGEHGASIFFDPAWFDTTPALWAGFFDPKRWTDGPPH